jgi:hypothetical protein
MARYEALIIYLKRGCQFRYNILDANRNKTFTLKQNLLSKQEKNLIEMETLYGKRTAAYLRGELMRESKKKYVEWEKRYKLKQEMLDQEVKDTEVKMLINSLYFVKKYLISNEPISLITMKVKQNTSKSKIGYDNVGNMKFLPYFLLFTEIIDLLNEASFHWISLIEPYLGSKYQQQHVELVRSLLDKLLAIHKGSVKIEDLLQFADCTDSRVRQIIKSQIPIIHGQIESFYKRRTDTMLTELKIAWMYSQYYNYIGNEEKAYMLLSKAYKQCRPAVDQYVTLYATYKRLRMILRNNFEEESTGNLHERFNLPSWKSNFVNQAKREIYVYDYLKHLESVVPVY